MSFQVHVLDESLPTDLAQEAALLVVEADVSVERLFLGEAFPTDATGESFLSTVDLQVRFQIPALVERLPADVAAVGFLSSVDPQVHLQRSVSRERLPTHVARVADVHVRAQVSGEAAAGLVLVPAEAAAAVRVVQVGLGVCRQSASPLKRLTTNLAAVGFCRLSFLRFPVFPMRGHVAPEAPLVAELLAAEGAGVHVLPAAMLGRVAFQRRQVTEAAAALQAPEGVDGGVHAAVGLQVTHQAELLPADGAAEGFLSGVKPQVQLLRQDGREAPPTHGAGLAALLVRLQVSAQSVCRVQPLATEAAESVLVGGTNLQDVFEQEAFAVQSTTTHLTQEALRRAAAPPPGFEPPPPLLSPGWTRRLILLRPLTVGVTAATS